MPRRGRPPRSRDVARSGYVSPHKGSPQVVRLGIAVAVGRARKLRAASRSSAALRTGRGGAPRRYGCTAPRRSHRASRLYRTLPLVRFIIECREHRAHRVAVESTALTGRDECLAVAAVVVELRALVQRYARGSLGDELAKSHGRNDRAYRALATAPFRRIIPDL